MSADRAGERHFPHEFMYKILRSGKLKKHYSQGTANSWLFAACEKNLPIWVPGWEDSTLGNMYAGHCIAGDVRRVHTVRTGIESIMTLADWYTAHARKLRLVNGSIGFFQIGGGIAGDFPICVVPMLHQDLRRTGCRSGDTSAKSAIRRRATGAIPGPFPAKRSPGANWGWRPPVSSSKATPPSWRL